MSKQKQQPPRLPASLAKALPSAIEAGKVLVQLERDLVKVQKEFEKTRRSGAIATARAFVVLRRLKDKMEETEKLFSLIFEMAAKSWLPETFEQEGVTNVPLQEGFRVTTSEKLYANILKENRAAAIKWLRENGLGDIVSEVLVVSDLDDKKRKAIHAWADRNGVKESLTESVNTSTLSAVARTLLEEQAKELPDDIFKTEFVKNTSVTAIKGKSISVS